MVRICIFFVLFFSFFPFNVEGQKSCALGDSITMKVVPCVWNLSSDFIDISISNNTDFRISCGSFYDFQKFCYDRWVDIDFGNMAWEAGIYYVNRNKTRMFRCYLNKDKYKYSPGKYRVIKYITIEKDIYERREIVADFILR